MWFVMFIPLLVLGINQKVPQKTVHGLHDSVKTIERVRITHYRLPDQTIMVDWHMAPKPEDR